MSADSPASLSTVKRALLEIRDLRARVAEFERVREPIAIVGLGLRTPGGVTDLDSFAELLWAGRDAITTIPPDRWSLDEWYDEKQDAPGKMTTRFGGFLSDVDSFDAEFFGISPLEAASMDPQQRLVLELAWEALEDAGHAPTSLAGSPTGVYLGIANGDYGRALFAHPEAIDPYFCPGNSFGVASGRLAYVLGLHGPALSIDTACSSSLVAIHLACQGLRLGECDMALAGGVNLILTPELNVNFSKAGMMSRDGRCKTFDAAADGYVRGEGGAILLLRRLRDAQAAGDRVLAVIRGSAVNQDGRSNGLTAPNGPAQEAVLRAALRSAGIHPGQIGYIEAHGTGTSLGDPIEVNALAVVMAEGRDETQPLMLGSVKTNIGHLEAAAGVVGLAKGLLCLQRREVPPNLHLKNPNPYIEWASIPLRVPTNVMPLPAIEGRHLAGVSSFGFSGTNAHVIVEEAPPVEHRQGTHADRPAQMMVVSARDNGALRELSQMYAKYLEVAQPEGAALADTCFTANAGRAHFAHRLAVTGASAGKLAEALVAFDHGRAHPNLVQGEASPKVPRIAFLFPGQGPQYAGMARELYDTAPAFREAFDSCAEALDLPLGRSIRSIVWPAAGETTPLDETAYAQPAMFAVEVALAALWRSWGVEPAAVMGHSFGEYAAACVSGAVRLADAARMVVARGQLVQTLPDDGTMAAIEAPEAAILAAVAERGGRVSIAAVNGPTNNVISGERAVVEAIVAQFAAAGARTKLLRVSHAFHSPLIEPVLNAFEREISNVEFSEPRMTLISNLSGRVADLALIGQAGYWRAHMRDPVRFADSIRALAAQGTTHYIEMSPHPVLLGMGAECVEGGHWLPSIREGKDAWETLLESLQHLYCSGVDVDWHALDRGGHRRRVRLPTYPFRRKRHWLDFAGASQELNSNAVTRWTAITGAVSRQASRGPLDLDVGAFAVKWEALARLTSTYAVKTFRELGLFLNGDERHSLDTVMAAGIAPTYRHLVHRWLQLVEQRGLLRADGRWFVADRPLQEPDLASMWREVEALFVGDQATLAYVRNCATRLTAVLCGRQSPLETLFPDGSFELARRLYEESAPMRYINGLASAAIEALSLTTGRQRALRVLEVGAGTGGTTASLLPSLSSGNARYCFSDVSDVFLSEARIRFGGYDFVEFRRFDLDADFAAQGYLPHSFDLIVAANAAHAMKDLPSAFARLLALLSPGGVVVLVESTEHLAHFDMTTGLIEGWQHFGDNLRSDNPLLKPDAWIAALEHAGFAEAKAWPSEGSAAEAIGQHLIIARAPGDARLGAAEPDPAAVVQAEADKATWNSSVDQSDEWRLRLMDTVPADRLDLLRELVRSAVVRVLRLDGSSPPALHDRLMDLGMDSLMAVQLRSNLDKALGLKRSLPATLMFDYPTVDAIAEYLSARTSGNLPPASQTPNSLPVMERVDEATVAAMSDDEIVRLLDQRLGAP